MTTSSKDFKVKNGLVVQGTTATVNGHNVITEAVIDVANPALGDALVYDGTTFTPSAVSAAGITPSDTAPLNPQPKDLWVNTSNNGLYYYYDDGNSSQWVQIGTTGPSGIITVTSPLINSGTSSAAALSLNQTLLSIANTQVTGLGTSSTKNIAITGDASSSQVVMGNDSRLTDTRTPTDNSVTSSKIVDGTIVNGDINASAAIAQSKIANLPTDIARITALETANASTNMSGLVPIIPTSVSVGSGTASVGASGLITFSNVSSIQLNGIFSSTYQNYRIILTQTAANANNMHYYRYTQNGSQISGTNYNYSHFYSQAASSGNTDNGTGASTGNLGYGGHLDMEVYRPFDSTVNHKLITNFNTYSQTAIWGTTAYQGSGSFDGIYFSNNTLTGYIQVYGYR